MVSRDLILSVGVLVISRGRRHRAPGADVARQARPRSSRWRPCSRPCCALLLQMPDRRCPGLRVAHRGLHRGLRAAVHRAGPEAAQPPVPPRRRADALSCARALVAADGRRGGGGAAARRRRPPPGSAPAIASWRSTAQPLRDAIDFHFHARRRAAWSSRVERQGRRAERCAWCAARAPTWASSSSRPRPAEIATCANKCVFCFIHQLPRGMRKSLYVKDDDFRLSFLHGNYITLTDLDEAELARIDRRSGCRRSTSPCTRPIPSCATGSSASRGVRRELLPRAGAAGQGRASGCTRRSCCARDWNDGAHLERTVHELAPLHPAVATTAVVPVGLTRHRERLPAAPHAHATTRRARSWPPIEAWQASFLAALGTPLRLRGGRAVSAGRAARCRRPRPTRASPVAEDGIGLVRRFEDDLRRARRRAPRARARAAARRHRGDRRAVRAAPARAARRLRVRGPARVGRAVANECFGRGDRRGGAPHRAGHPARSSPARRPRRRGPGARGGAARRRRACSSTT